MNADRFEQSEGWTTSYFTSAMAGAFAGLCVAMLYGFALIASEGVTPSPLDTLWSAAVLVVLVLCFGGALIALPTALLFAGLMALLERISPRARKLPVWLASGLITALPLWLLMWNGMQGPGADTPPHSVIVSQGGMLVVAALAGAGTAWWTRHRSWKL